MTGIHLEPALSWEEGITLFAVLTVLGWRLRCRAGQSKARGRRRTRAAAWRTRWLVRFDRQRPEVHLHLMVVEAGAAAVGRAPAQLVLWRHYGLLPLGVWRGDTWIAEPSNTLRLEPGDRLVLSGPSGGALRCRHLFQPPHLRQA
jgi:hypothetical protein